MTFNCVTWRRNAARVNFSGEGEGKEMQTMPADAKGGTSVLAAPPGAGATERALQELRNLQNAPDWPCAWVLLPDGIREAAFRQRLLAREADGSSTGNIRLLRFDGLVGQVLAMAGRPTQVLRQEEREGLLRDLIDDLARNDEVELHAAATGMPGLLRAIAAFLDAMRHQLLSPEDFAAAADSRRDRELARIAIRYQSTLATQDRQDRTARLRQAQEALDDAALQDELAQEVDLLLVDGFDRFTPLQASLLMKLAACVRRALVTLPALPGRDSTAGARFRRTLSLLQQHSPRPLRLETLSAGSETLQQVAAQLFRPDGEAQQPGASLVTLEAPRPMQEARAITRRIRELLLETDTRPEECLIALRDWVRYASHLRVAGREHGLQLACTRGAPLGDLPAIRYLLRLLKLADDDFPLQDLLDVLRAPCFRVRGLGREQVELLDGIGRERRIAGGREAWLTAVRNSGHADADALAQALGDFMDAVTVPGSTAGMARWQWLRRLCGLEREAEAGGYTLDMRECASLDGPAWLRARESAALRALERLLTRKARDNHRTLQAREATGEESFWLEFRTAVENEHLAAELPQAGVVLIVEAGAAAGLSARHLFMPGLSADSFPRQREADPLHLPGERQALAERGADLGPARPGMDDALFVQLVSLARESLMLTRPTVNRGTLLEASHLWQEVRRVCPQHKVKAVRANDVAPVNEVASVEEALVALAAGPAARSAGALRGWLQREHAGLLAQVEHARQVEVGRLSRFHDHDRYSGVLSDAGLIARVANMLGPGKLWSATQLNDLGAGCLRFFAGRLLELEEPWQPEPGLNALEAGSLNHAILERVYRSLKARQLTIDPANLQEALQVLDCEAQAVFDAAPRILKRDLDALWPWEQQGILSRLKAFVQLDFSVESPLDKQLPGGVRRVLWQEVQFGWNDDRFGIPLTVNGELEDLRLRGVIDRIDVAGTQALVADYKSGSTTIKRNEVLTGVNVQMPIYLQAARHLLKQLDPGLQLTGGLFLHLRGTTGSSGSLRTNERDDGLVAAAMTRIAENIAAARRGDFRVEPRLPAANGRCVRYCEFSELCRVKDTRSPVQDGPA